MNMWVENYPRRPRNGQAFDRHVLWRSPKAGQATEASPGSPDKASPLFLSQGLAANLETQRKGHLGSATV